MIRITLVLVTTLSLGAVAQSDTLPPPSPCPTVYGYGWTASGGWHGVISIIPPLYFSEVQLTVRLHLPYYRPEAGVGRIEIKGGQSAVQQISTKAIRGVRQKIQYAVIFPPFKELPRIAGVTINGKNFCPVTQTYSDTRGTIELKYSLKSGLSIPMSPGTEFTAGGGEMQMATTPRPADTADVIYVVQTGQGTYVIPPTRRPSTTAPTPAPAHTPSPTPAPTPAPIMSTTELDIEDLYAQIINGSSPVVTTTTEAPEVTTKKKRPRPQKTTRPPRTTTTTTAEPDYEDIGGEEAVQSDANEYLVNSLNCGIPRVAANTLVIRGEDTEKGQWPWQAAMFKQSSTGLTFQCGGSLISRRHVVTAGHCVYLRAKNKTVEVETILIYLGKHNLRSWTEDGQQAKDVNEIKIHPKYGTNNHDYDLAIIVLATAAILSNYVKPVCLWDRNDNLQPLINKTGSVLGWGRDENGDMGNTLKLARMPIVSQETCLRSDTFYTVFTTDHTFCAGFRNGVSVCNGDSGGGMYFLLENSKQKVKTWYTRGVVSVSKLEASEQVCDDKSFVVFTDLAKLMPWIKKQLSPPTT